MPKKILLFLSDRKDGAPEQVYTCPDGTDITGIQTNEAPVKYLLHEHPDVKEILCLVTPTAKSGAWQPFTELVGSFAPNAVITEIPYSEKAGASGELVPSIISHIQKGDELLLETTGGPRDVVMQMLLVSRILRYAGTETAGAIYSNFAGKEICDVSHLVELFDLVGGMQEFASFGDVKTLRAYYESHPKTTAVENLLKAMEDLKEAITLCRTQRIEEYLQAFNEAFSQMAKDADPLMQILLPIFQQKFGEKLTVPGLIRWCVENDMLQQALTVYTERIPKYMIGDLQMVEMPAECKAMRLKEYQDAETEFFQNNLLMMSASVPRFLNFYQRNISMIRDCIEGRAKLTTLSTSREVAIGIRNLVMVFQKAYPEPYYFYDRNWGYTLPQSKNSLWVIGKLLEKKCKTLDAALETVKDFSVQFCLLLMELSNGNNERKNFHVETIRQLGALIPEYGYSVSVSEEQFSVVMRDYMYIKALRNMTNHANSTPTWDQKILMDYLDQYDYLPLEKVSSDYLKATILQALEHLEI